MSKDDHEPDAQEILQARLYVNPGQKGKLAPPPQILPDNNPLYPKRVTQLRNLKNTGHVAHFSQLQTQLKAVPQQLAPVVRQERIAITTLREPLEAAKMLQQAPEGTFFYMQRVDKLREVEKGKFKLQDLELLETKEEFEVLVCPHTVVDLKNYLTISSAGVTLISDAQQSFTELKLWIDELEKLQKLRQIPIFKNFRLWKPLKLLKKAVLKNRQQRAGVQLGQNLFSINYYLRYSLALTLECTTSIRLMTIIVTQLDIDQFNNAKALARKQQKDKKSVVIADDQFKEIKIEYNSRCKQMTKFFESYQLNKAIKAAVENEDDMHESMGTPSNVGKVDKVFKYPFTVQDFEQMMISRCSDLGGLFDQVMQALLAQIREMIDAVIVAQFGANQEKTVKQAATYTEKAARINLCRRLVNYLRQTDFMLMDSLYDFQFTVISKLHTRCADAGKLVLPTAAQVVASREDLEAREKAGVYSFDGRTVEGAQGEEGDVMGDDSGKVHQVGDSSRCVFLGYVQCRAEDSKSPGCRELRQISDEPTPGDVVGSGQTAVICLYPAQIDFAHAVDAFNEAVLSVLDCIKRFTNHEDFADVSLPIYCNTEATFEHTDDQAKLQLLAEVSAPTLQVLYASNPQFKLLVNALADELVNQYKRASEWIAIFQPFYDAFNQCLTLNVDQIQKKLFQIPIGVFDGGDVSKKDPKWVEPFKRITTMSVWQENNDYDAAMTELIAIDFKDVATMSETLLTYAITAKSQVPLCTKSGLTQHTLPEFLVSDQEIDDLLCQMEHNRRLHTSMPEVVHLGMFSFDCHQLKEAFLPVSQRCLNFLRYAIPSAIVKRLILLLMNMNMMKKYVTSTFYDVESFILYREVVQLISDESIDTIKSLYVNMVQLAAKFESHGIILPPQIKNLFTFFNTQFDGFKSLIINAEAQLDVTTANWLKKQEDECAKCQVELDKLKVQTRLKSLNTVVPILTIAEMAQFITEYQQDVAEFTKVQNNYVSQLEVAEMERNKLVQAELPTDEIDEKIKDIKQILFPESMLTPVSKLTSDIIIQQHKFYVQTEEQVEEQQEGDELEEEKIEAIPAEDGDGIPGEEPEAEGVNLEEEKIIKKEEKVEEKLTLHAKISKCFIKLNQKSAKTELQKKQLDIVEARIKQLKGYQIALSTEPHDFPLLEVVSTSIRQYYQLWTNTFTWLSNMTVFSRQNFMGDLNQETLAQLVSQVGKIAFMCERAITTSEMPVVLKQRVTEMRQILPIVASLDNPALRMQHWKNVGDILGKQVPMLELKQGEDQKANYKPVVNIAWLVASNAQLYREQLSQQSSNAANELSLEKQYKKIEAEWAKIDLQSAPFKDMHDIFVLKETAELITKLEDAILIVSGIVCSRYVAGLKETVELFFDRLRSLAAALDLFLKVQKGYLYLLNIFSSADIQKQLANETKMFQELDVFWKKLLAKIQDYPQALNVTTFQIIQVKDTPEQLGLSSKASPLEIQLRKQELVLDQIQKSLDNYLQTKRMAFARLFFISDDELLDLLAQAKNPHALQGHMRKLFENVVQMELVNNVQAGGLEIVSLISEEGEKLQLVQSVKPRGSVVAWLTTLEQKMKQSVAKQVKQAIDGYQAFQTRNQWIVANMGQTVIAGSQVFWCSYLTEAIDGKSDLAELGYGRLKGEVSCFAQAKIDAKGQKQANPMAVYYSKFEADLLSLITLIKSNLTKLQRGMVTALATIETHSRDTIGQLVQSRPGSTAEFEFQKLQRYYYNPSDLETPILLRQNTTTISYCNEYLGASGRLVITPLTDLVFLHISVSIQNCKAINLAGPAGTGKSETTKDLNKARANACVVFNCSDNVEISVMNRFFTGFCMTGAGSCLDEFNRLELSLLSVIAGSIKQILDGLKVVRNTQQKNILFDGQDINLNPETMIAISLNPGYAGRAELPQNLKNLFRTFSMVVPDYSLISEIILFSQGFTTAKPLSRKVVQLYKLSSEQLSQQNSYDFGMRGVKSVLSMAGNLRRKFPDQTEEAVLIKAMQDSNLPRMIAEDRELFMGIIQDLFPSVIYEKSTNKDFVKCVEQSLREHNYQNNAIFTEKVAQVFETSQIRHGVLLMGPAKSGKTVCLRTLCEALGKLRNLVETEYKPDQKKSFDSNFPLTIVNSTDIYLINSKAITGNELYGSYDEASGEWKDGLFGNIMRTCLENSKTNELKTHKQFILFDAHVSTEWIESMNSLLDDSKLLCLANSERLKINDYINIVFECETLKHASPATVSRLGIINFPEATLADTHKMLAIQMRPNGGFKNMTDDEVQAHEVNVLRKAVAQSLKESIVRWDHLIETWFEKGFNKLLIFRGLGEMVKMGKQGMNTKQATTSIEEQVALRIRSLIYKLFQMFVPIGLKFLAGGAQAILPSNEVQLVQQTIDIFSALLNYNRSLSVVTKNEQQKELNKFAQENGLAEPQKATEVTDLEPIDIGTLVRFLCVQFLARNGTLLQNPPAASKMMEMLSDHVMNSPELATVEMVIKQAFMFAFVWGFGGPLAAGVKAAREEFDGIVRTLIEVANEDAALAKTGGKDYSKDAGIAPFEDMKKNLEFSITLPLMPNSGSVFDYYVDWRAVLAFQLRIIENLPFIQVTPCIRDAFKSYQIKNDQSFNLGSCVQIYQSISLIQSTLPQLTDDQQALIQAEILKPSDIHFEQFKDLLVPYVYKPKLPFFNVFIETQDTLRYQHLIETLLKNNLSVLLTGSAGSGKTSVIAAMLDSMDKRGLTQNIIVNFSARTSSLRVQQIIEDSLFQKGKTYLPQPGKSGIVYIDDMNLPAKDQYECSQPIEFLRLFLDTKGFYDRKELWWKNVENTTLLGSCAQPGGGRETLTMRLTTSFTMVAQPESEDESLIKIYNTMLESFFAYKEYKFPQDIIQSSQGIVKALITVYHQLSAILKPTPSKLHYSFNLRDVSKVIQGMLRSSSKILKSSEEMISMFIHEVMRVFSDRTVNAFDNEQIAKTVVEALNTCPNTGLKKTLTYEAMFEEDGSLREVEKVEENQNAEFKTLWGNYMKIGVPVEERIYETKDTKFVQQTMYQYLTDYNDEPGKQKMNLVLFEDAVNYVNKIARILSSERGSLLNVGVGGSGRKSLTRLAASMCDLAVRSIQLKKGYGQADFHADVKELYKSCGLDGNSIVFLLDESQLVSEAILEDINNILNSGVISNLFDQKDMEIIINKTRTFINEQGMADVVDTNNKASVFSFFISRVRDKLHIVLCMSPSGDSFRARLRTYPSLLTCMSIVWFHPWPRSALHDVSKRILTDDLQKVDFSAITGADIDAQAKFAKNLALKLAPVATEIHSNTERLLINYAAQTNRRHYLPPATFLDLLSIYSTLLNNRIQEISTRLNQFKTGVERLIDAKSQVETLQKQQEQLKPVLEQKTIATNELIAQINTETVQVNELRKKAMDDAQIVAVQTKDCQMIAADADRDLKACEPIIAEATRAVDNIDSGMIAEMKQVKNPAPLVFLTMQSVAVLLGYKPDWAGCVQMFSNNQFLNSLKEYDKNNIPDAILKNLKKFTETKQYDLPAIEKVSVACKSLAVWVLAIEKYAQVYREVEPKRKRLQQANDDLQVKQDALKVKQAQLKVVEDAFQVLQDKFNKSNNEKLELEKAMDLTKARLDRAEKLTGALGDEQIRWIKQSEDLAEMMTMVVGDVFLAACGIGYFGVFNRDYRNKLITYWHGLLNIYGIKTKGIDQILAKGLFSLISSDEMIIERWKECGLPNDMQSIDNSVIIDQITQLKWPLLIDPQNQGANFIKKMEKKIKVIRPTQFGIARIFEQCIADGDVVLLEGVGEKLDPSLQPVVEKQFVMNSGGKLVVNMGDKEIEVNKDFKLYITTKLQNPKYSPEIHAKLQIINFSISVDALESQILSEVIQLEYPKLEETRVELTKDASNSKKALVELADKILYNLSSFQGSVLDNQPLIEVLNESKRVSQLIKEKEIASASTRLEIAKYYELYRPIGIRAALVYFLISDMSMVEPMYLFALSYYKQLVQQEIKKIKDFYNEQEKIAQRVEIIIEKLTFAMFNSITRGLFEKDKNTFAFLLGCRVFQRKGEIKDEEWNLFVKGKVYSDIFLTDPVNIKTDPEKLKLVEQLKSRNMSDKIASQIELMANVEYLRPLAKTILEHYDDLIVMIKDNKMQQSEMLNFIISLAPDQKDHFKDIDALINPQTTPFQRLILTKLLADEYFYSAVPQLVEMLLDKRYAAIQPQSIKSLYLDSNQFSPMLFIISEGVDPVAQTCALAEELKQQVVIISLGKGQTPLVMKELQKATSDGKWVFLQNVHLAAADFLPELELIVETLALSQSSPVSQLEYITVPINPSFRLILSSTPTSAFPQSVLQASLKCTTEPPIGMKKNILRQGSMMEAGRYEFDQLKAKIPATLNQEGVILTWKRVVYSLMYFHSQVLERKKFGPQGYNLNYDFNDTDVEICILTLEDFFLKAFGSQQTLTDQYIGLDWPALEFIFGAIHYSGKVNDSWDKRCVATLLRSVVGPKLTKTNNVTNVNGISSHNWVEGDPRYGIGFVNSKTTIADVLTHVQSLPAIDSTKVFGMSDNSDVVNRQAEATRIVQRVLDVSADCLKKFVEQVEAKADQAPAAEAPKAVEQPKKGKVEVKKEDGAVLKQQILDLNIKVFGIEVKAKTMDEIVRGITENLLNKLPKPLNINDAAPESVGYDDNGIPLCMTTILKQEMERFNILLDFVKKSLTNVGLAIKGDVILSQDLEDQYKSLYIGKVPAAWNKIAYPSLKPLAAWFDDLILRVIFMRKWLTTGIPTSTWMSGLYFPQGFVTALLQTHARKYKISVDSLKFEFQFAQQVWDDYEGKNLGKNYIQQKEPTAVWVHGLYVDCGYFDIDETKLQASREGLLYPKMPFVKLVPTDSTAEQPGYTSPVYKTSQRAGVLSSTGHSTNFILPVKLPTDLQEDFFVRLGTACLCQLDE